MAGSGLFDERGQRRNDLGLFFNLLLYFHGFIRKRCSRKTHE